MTPHDQLLRDCLAYFLKHGVANLSLRPLAAAAGTSARMLLHHFGSKEELIFGVMEQVRVKLQSSFASLELQTRVATPADLMLAFWRTITTTRNLPHMRLLFEVQVLAIQNPKRYRRYLADTSGSWLQLIADALPASKDKAAIATLNTAVIDGLLLELLSTGDLRRTSNAVAIFAAAMREKQRRSLPSRRGRRSRP